MSAPMSLPVAESDGPMTERPNEDLTSGTSCTGSSATTPSSTTSCFNYLLGKDVDASPSGAKRPDSNKLDRFTACRLRSARISMLERKLKKLVQRARSAGVADACMPQIDDNENLHRPKQTRWKQARITALERAIRRLKKGIRTVDCGKEVNLEAVRKTANLEGKHSIMVHPTFNRGCSVEEPSQVTWTTSNCSCGGAPQQPPTAESSIGDEPQNSTLFCTDVFGPSELSDQNWTSCDYADPQQLLADATIEGSRISEAEGNVLGDPIQFYDGDIDWTTLDPWLDSAPLTQSLGLTQPSTLSSSSAFSYCGPQDPFALPESDQPCITSALSTGRNIEAHAPHTNIVPYDFLDWHNFTGDHQEQPAVETAFQLPFESPNDGLVAPTNVMPCSLQCSSQAAGTYHVQSPVSTFTWPLRGEHHASSTKCSTHGGQFGSPNVVDTTVSYIDTLQKADERPIQPDCSCRRDKTALFGPWSDLEELGMVPGSSILSVPERWQSSHNTPQTMIQSSSDVGADALFIVPDLDCFTNANDTPAICPRSHFTLPDAESSQSQVKALDGFTEADMTAENCRPADTSFLEMIDWDELNRDWQNSAIANDLINLPTTEAFLNVLEHDGVEENPQNTIVEEDPTTSDAFWDMIDWDEVNRDWQALMADASRA